MIMQHHASQLCGSALESSVGGCRIDSRVKTFLLFHLVTILLVYIIQRITTRKLRIFRRYITIHASLYDPIVRGASINPRHKFVCPLCWYYLRQEIENY
jgi:hypothetical protein